MPAYAVYMTNLGTSVARPVERILECPTTDLAIQTLDANEATIEITNAADFYNLDDNTETNRYDFTVDSTASPPTTVTAVTVARYSLTERQEAIRRRVKALIERYSYNQTPFREYTATRFNDWRIYIRDLLRVEAQGIFASNPDGVTWPTIPTETEDDTGESIWEKLYRKGNGGNTVGTVTMGGWGGPQGSLFETGNNSNGDYVRFADGTQICWHKKSSPSAETTWTFPAAFISTSTVVTGAPYVGSGTTLGAFLCRVPSTTAVDFCVVDTSNTRMTRSVALFAVGKWV